MIVNRKRNGRARMRFTPGDLGRVRLSGDDSPSRSAPTQAICDPDKIREIAERAVALARAGKI